MRLPHLPADAREFQLLMRPVWRFLAILAFYSLVTLLLFRQVLPHLSSVLMGPPEDNMQDFWNSLYATEAHPDGFLFTRTIRFPEGTALFYHAFAYPQVFLVWLLSKIFGTKLATILLLHNLTLLASFPLAGAGAYYLCRHFSTNIPGCLAGGFLYAFAPAHVAQTMHHASVASIEFIPWFVLCYLVALERRSAGWLVAATLFNALGAISCWYYFFYNFYFMAFHYLYQWVRDRRLPRGWALIAPAAAMAGTVLLLSRLLVPMILRGLHHDIDYGGTNFFAADVMAYLAFPYSHLLAPLTSRFIAGFTGNPWENAIYLGLVNLAVLGYALWRSREADRRLLLYLLAGMAFFAVIGAGDSLHVGGWLTRLHMPALILGKLPFFANIRTPERAVVYIQLFLGVAIAVAAAMALRGRPSPAIKAGAALVAVLMVLDFLPAGFETTPVTCSPVLDVIAADREPGFGVVDFPDDYTEGNYYMVQQACHGRPIVRGETARKVSASLADRLDVHDLAAQHRQLVAARVKYVVLHRPVGPLAGWREFPKGHLFQWTKYDGVYADYFRQYRVVAEDPSITVLRVY